VFASLSTKGFKKAKESTSLGANPLRDYAKEKLRQNMGQGKSKQRDIKE
jgi:hypothetical protein